MSTRRSVQQPDPGQDMRGAVRTVPHCQCGFVGHPTDQATPYVACGGDPARHQRRPVRAGVPA